VQDKIKASGLPQRDIRFMRGEVRVFLSVSEKQIRVHLDRLAAMEYILVHRGQRGQSFEYELLHDQSMASEEAHLSGLLDVAALQSTPAAATTATAAPIAPTTASSWGQGGEFVGPSCPQRGAKVAGSRSIKTSASPHEIRHSAETPDEASDSRATPTQRAGASYLQPLAA
jgi:hypothetical protein